MQAAAGTHARCRKQLAASLASTPYMLLDGALATELEKHPGCNLGQDDDRLWSARVLADNPELIYRTHLAYFVDGGADVVITASYQASTRGLTDAGFTDEESFQLIEQSVALARKAREAAEAAAASAHASTLFNHAPSSFPFTDDNVATAVQPRERFIAGSVGPYGAYLANGAEYTGSYCLSIADLQGFHRPRMRILLDAGADVLACETIPSITELEALVSLLDELGAYAWISVTLKDAKHMSDGTPLVRVGRLLASADRVLALGVNCVPPELVTGALHEFGRVSSSKPFVVYPNSGEVYDAVTKQWIPTDAQNSGDAHGSVRKDHWAARYVSEWYGLGARVFGGCCRTSPDDIRAIRDVLHDSSRRSWTWPKS